MMFRYLPLAAVFGCGATTTQVEIPPPPAKTTRGSLAGPLCTPDGCSCRSDDKDAGTPDDGRKRFEIRLESAYELWVTLPDGVLYKSPERAEACFYVDFHPGKHPLTLRASQPSGVSFALTVRELGTKTHSWYDTFSFGCGHPGVCSLDELAIRRNELKQVARNIHDLCGSTKVKGVTWDHGRVPDKEHPSELVLRLSLDIYKFAPWKPHGDPTCGKGSGPEEMPADGD